MIQSIRIANFKSFQDATLPLASLTMLIGPNASGKSNALEAIRLLSLLAKGQRLDEISRATASNRVRGQALDMFRSKKEYILLACTVLSPQNEQFELELQLGIQGGLLVVKEEELRSLSPIIPLYHTHLKTSYRSDDIEVAYNDYKQGPHRPIVNCSNRQAIFYQLLDATRFKPKDEKSKKIIPQVTQLFRELLSNIVFLDPRPSTMRGYSFSKDDVIKEDGSNLSSVLYQICLNEDDKATMLKLIKSLPEQDISDIGFIVTERQDVMVKLTETFGGRKKTFDATMLSDGTLRVLAIGAALMRAKPGSLVIIEEVDNGVHPSRAKQLMKSIQTIGKRRNLRVLMSSHNPALLDAIPDELVGDVISCYRSPKTGNSEMTRLADLDSYPELISQGSLGYLMTVQAIEKYLKDNLSSEDRKKKALHWLEQLPKD